MPVGRSVGRAYATLTLRNKQFIGGLLSAQGNLKSFKRLAVIGFGAVAAAALGASVAILKIGSSAVSAATTFDRRAREINTLARLSSEEFINMKNQIIGMSSRLGMDATGMAQALYQINSACYKGAEGMKILEATTKLAVAGLANQESVANAVTTALRAWGISADNVTRVTDVMFKTVELGKIKVEEIAQGLGYTASIAAQAGLSIEQVSAAVAVLTKGGIQGTRAFRGVSQILSTLIKPSEEAAVAFKDIGISAASIKEIGLIGVLKKIREASEGNIETLATFIPNVRALRGALVLTGSMMEDYEQNLVAIKDSTGATNNAFEEMNKSFARFKEIWGTRFRNVMIQLGDRIIPTLQKSLQEFFQPENLKLFIVGMASVGEVITKSLAHIPVIIGTIASSFKDLEVVNLRAMKAWYLFARITSIGSEEFDRYQEALEATNETIEANRKGKENLIKKYSEMYEILLKSQPNWDDFKDGVMGLTFNFGKLNEETDGTSAFLAAINAEIERTNQLMLSAAQGLQGWSFPIKKSTEAADMLGETLKNLPEDWFFPDKIKESTEKMRALELAADAVGTALGTAFQKGIDMGQRLRQIIKSTASALARMLIPGIGGQALGGFIQALPFDSGGVVPKRMPLVNLATYNENPKNPESVFGLPGGSKAIIPWDKMPQMVKAEVYVTNANPDTQVRTIIKANPDAMNELWRRGIRPAMERDGYR